MPPRVGTAAVVAVSAAALLVVVGELYQHIIAFLNIGFHLVPQAFVDKRAGTASATGVVDDFDIIGKKFLEHLTPAAGASRVLGIVGHGRVADGVHANFLFGLCRQEQAEQGQCNEQSLFHVREY